MAGPAAIVLDDTICGEFSNSYVDQDYADEYWDQHWDVNSAGQWAALTDTQKAALLAHACRDIETLRFTEPVDALAPWKLVIDTRTNSARSVKSNYNRPQRYAIEQNLQFPRTLEVDTSGQTYIPETIKYAQCEQALYRLNLDTSVMANRLQGVSHDMLSVGGVQFSQKIEAKSTLVGPITYSYCKPLMLKTNLRIQRA